MPRADRLTLEALGRSPQAAIRTLLDAFRRRGWSDSGAAIAIVEALEEAQGSLGFGAAARRVPTDFLVRNELKHSEVERALRDLAERQ